MYLLNNLRWDSRHGRGFRLLGRGLLHFADKFLQPVVGLVASLTVLPFGSAQLEVDPALTCERY
jgi:hypothetical protein